MIKSDTEPLPATALKQGSYVCLAVIIFIVSINIPHSRGDYHTVEMFTVSEANTSDRCKKLKSWYQSIHCRKVLSRLHL